MSRIIILFFLFSPFIVSAQSEDVSLENPELENLLDQALELAYDEQWDDALAMLKQAENLNTEDPRIDSYRESIRKLRGLDEPQQAWDEDVEISEDEPLEPKFVIDRQDDGLKRAPLQSRDIFRGEVGLKFFVVDTILDDAVNSWSSLEEVFLSSVTLDLRYWFPFLGRSLGISSGSRGYSWRPGQPDYIVNFLDLGINLRGFLLEEQNSRMELGLDFGISLKSTRYNKHNLFTNKMNLFFKLWISDPVLFHLFRAEALENLLFIAALQFHADTGAGATETINITSDVAWRFRRMIAGIRFEWWDISEFAGNSIIPSFALFGGLHF